MCAILDPPLNFRLMLYSGPEMISQAVLFFSGPEMISQGVLVFSAATFIMKLNKTF